MKTKLFIILLAAVVLISFTGLRSSKYGFSKETAEPKSYQSSGGQTMNDLDQFN